MKRDDTVYLRHILDAITQVQEYVAGLSQEEFSARRMVHDAVIRQIEIIGEATKNLDPQVLEAYPDVPWKQMAGMRDKLIHQYFGVDLEAVWDVAVEDIPTLKDQVASILQELLKGLKT